MINRKFRCCICREYSRGYGNDPRPIKDKGKCCDTCYFREVSPEKLKLIKERVKEEERKKLQKKNKSYLSRVE